MKKVQIFNIIDFIIERYGPRMGIPYNGWMNRIHLLLNSKSDFPESTRKTLSFQNIETWKKNDSPDENGNVRGTRIHIKTAENLAGFFRPVIPEIQAHWFFSETKEEFSSLLVFNDEKNSLLESGLFWDQNSPSS